jgi:polysaccharide export outer membrane protein
MPAAGADYRIGPRDVVRVVVFDEAQLSGTYPVLPDGNAVLPLLGPTYLAGLSLNQASERVTGAYADRFLQNPYVTLQIETYGASQVKVLGEVKSPGTYSLSGPTSLLDLLTKAGGLIDQDTKELRLHHRDGSEQSIPLEAMMGGTTEVVLADGDVVSVPKARKVYIAGQVKTPGSVAFSDGLTVSRALTLAGDVSSSARLSGVYVLRKGERIKVNLSRVRSLRAPDLLLLADDQVVVPESPFK